MPLFTRLPVSMAKFSLAAALLWIPPATFAADNSPAVGKVRYILGEVTVQKKAKTNWNPLRIGLKVRENDLIRTLVESEAGIALSDGSLITIEENTTILFETAVNNQMGNVTSVQLKSGRVFFDVQKQKEGSSFEFKTGTATAAIRGTNGFVESGEEGIIVSLESGKMVVTGEDGKTLEVNGGETLVQDTEKGLKKFKSPSSGSRGLAKEISNERQNGKIQVDSLEKKALDLDKKNAPKTDSLSKANPCRFDPIPEKTAATEISVSGSCKENVSVRVNGVEAKLEKGKFIVPLSWEKGSYGEKRIRVKCAVGNAETLCLETSAEYVKPTGGDALAFIRIQKGKPLATDGSADIVVEGEFFSEDPEAKVTVSLGKTTSGNLNGKRANGHFSYAFSPNDPKVEWTETLVKATLQSKKKKVSDSAAVSFPAKIRITGQKDCEIQIQLAGTRGQKVRVEETVDGVPVTSAVFEKDAKAALPMLSGKHFYRIFTQDEKGGGSEDSGTFLCKE